jgi:hypothetical protein
MLAAAAAGCACSNVLNMHSQWKVVRGGRVLGLGKLKATIYLLIHRMVVAPQAVQPCQVN